ncbi:MAG: DUF507 family protein [Deltaproteobacteria bacterium]|nr:DUF507 family protein [Deltaproteobacteria bacterium]
MKLTLEQVEKIAELVLDALKKKGLITLKTGEHQALQKINDVILADLRAEDSLDREVEEILKTHTGEIDSQRIDYRKMFNMIKGKLARERGIVI